jgi:hypothetical protein
MGYRKLSARPRHHAQAAGAIEDFKKPVAGRRPPVEVETGMISCLSEVERPIAFWWR